MTAFAIPFVYPFVFLVSVAFKTPADYNANQLGLPREITLDNLEFAWKQANLGQAMFNSMYSVGLSVLILVPISAMGGYWALRHQGRIGRSTVGVLFALWAIPFIVYALPFYIMAARSGLLNNLALLGLLYATLNIPFGVYLMYSYYQRGVPAELLESAAVDGAGTWRTFQSLVLPLGRPALGTLAALGFIWSWGDLIIAAFLLQDNESYTTTLAAAGLVGRYDASVQPSAAAALLSMLPLLLVFLVAQRAIAGGFTAGVGK